MKRRSFLKAMGALASAIPLAKLPAAEPKHAATARAVFPSEALNPPKQPPIARRYSESELLRGKRSKLVMEKWSNSRIIEIDHIKSFNMDSDAVTIDVADLNPTYKGAYVQALG